MGNKVHGLLFFRCLLSFKKLVLAKCYTSWFSASLFLMVYRLFNLAVESHCDAFITDAVTIVLYNLMITFLGIGIDNIGGKEVM